MTDNTRGEYGVRVTFGPDRKTRTAYVVTDNESDAHDLAAEAFRDVHGTEVISTPGE